MWEFLSFNTTLRIFYLCGVLHFSYRTSLASGGRTCLCLQQTSGAEQRIIEQFYTLQQSGEVAGIILYMWMDSVHQNLLQWGADLRFLEHKRVTEISPIQVSFEACFQGRGSGIEHGGTGNIVPLPSSHPLGGWIWGLVACLNLELLWWEKSLSLLSLWTGSLSKKWVFWKLSTVGDGT